MKRILLIICLLLCIAGCVRTSDYVTIAPDNHYEIRDAAKKEETRKRREEYVDEHIPFGYGRYAWRSAILNGELIIGMTKNEVRASIGSPEDISIYKSVYGTVETWDYNCYDYYSYCSGPIVTFDNGIMTSIFYP